MKFPNLDDAPCAELGTDLFFLDRSDMHWVTTRNSLRKICNACPVQEACLEWSLRHEEFGWWGGYSAAERANMRREMGILLENINSHWSRSAS